MENSSEKSPIDRWHTPHSQWSLTPSICNVMALFTYIKDQVLAKIQQFLFDMNISLHFYIIQLSWIMFSSLFQVRINSGTMNHVDIW
jgi:hypothetical protein